MQVKKYSDSEVHRNRIILIIVIVAIIAAAAFMIHSCVSGGSNSVDAPSSAAVKVDNQASATAQASASSAAADSSAASEPAAVEVDPALEGRAADFAVDPNRTDWNYEVNGRKVVYLTIDDGPSDKTQQVLDILDKYGCKATFFVVGHDDANFPMIKKAFEKGHTIGLHSYSHNYAEIYSSDEAYLQDLEHIGQVVRDQIGFVPAFIRFPGGSSNTISRDYSEGIMSRLTETVQSMGYQYYDWNVSSGDGADIGTEDFVRNCTVDVDDYENIVLLMHDSTTKQSSIDGLPAVIEYWQAKGYTFEAIDRDSIVEHHGISN